MVRGAAAPAQQPQAQQPAQSRRLAAAVALATQLLELKGGIGAFDPAIEGVIDAAPRASCCRSIRTSPGTLTRRSQIVRARGIAARRQELRDEIARGLCERFTEQELKDLLDFYKTPLGKKMIESEPKAGEAVHQARAGVDREICRGRHGQNARRDEEEGPHRFLSRRSRALDGTMAMPEEVDLFVIGAGSGGVRAARIASGYGARVMIAEEYRVGGTCVIRGCVPKKLLVYASRFADEFEDAAGFGWTRAGAEVRLADADRQQGQGDRRLEAAYTANLERAKVDDRQEPRGAGRSAHRQAASRPARRVRAKHILIATGGCALARQGHRRPRARHLVERGVSSQGTAEAHPDPGRRLYRGRVRRHLQRPRLRGDAGLSRRQHPARLRRRRAQSSARRDGKARHQDHHQEDRRGRSRRSITASASSLSDHEDIVVDKVMFATGRRPNVKGLGLEAAGVKLDENGAIAVDEFSQTIGAAHLRGRRRHRPDRADAGRDPRGPCLRRHACSAASRRRSITPTCRPRCSPSRKCGVIGLTEAQACEQLAKVDIYKTTFRPMKATLSGRDTRTFMKLVVDGIDRPRGRLPYRRAGRRRDDPADRHRGEDGGDQGRLRRHHGGASDRRRRARDHAREDREPRPPGGGIGGRFQRFDGDSRRSAARPPAALAYSVRCSL